MLRFNLYEVTAFVLTIAFVLGIAACQSPAAAERARREKCSSNLRSIAEALNNYTISAPPSVPLPADFEIPLP